MSKLRRLLTPLCWTRTRMAWPYPVSGHSYKFIRQEQRGDRYYQILECMTCGRVSDNTWSTEAFDE